MRRGAAQLDSFDTILAQISALTNMVKNMQKQPTIQEVKVMESFCEICGNNHDSSDMGRIQNPAAITSNPQGYQNQPRQNQPLNLPRQDYQQPNNYRTLENTLNAFMTQTCAYMARTDQFIQKTDAFMDRTELRMQNQEAALKSLENQVGQISQALNSRPMGGFPSDTEVAKGAIHEQCKAISTRSGKILTTPNKDKQGKDSADSSKAAAVLDNLAPTDVPTSAEENHDIPTEHGEANPNKIATPKNRLL
ncbi:hypothetical protein V6N13_124827 [Hibiscus sabdariffa]|uniref:Uncharacterized protein n=1 Tax=Hibiscus sabdariffa TaxID=183260 RepID=A0ABR2U4U8_9ROSI